MKNNLPLFLLSIIILLTIPNQNFAQAPNLGTAASFVLFTTTGAVGNAGISQITGNVGTNTGAITGCDSVIGEVHNTDAVTMQCSLDLENAYAQLFNTAPTSSSHAPAFGNDETLFPGVYSIAGAGSVTGTLTLDAQGDTAAIFIFKFAGAFTTGAPASVDLINGASSCNVFWVAEGAVSMATGTNMKGTLIANNGAASLAAGGTLEGRLLSTTGAVNVDGVISAVPVGCSFTSLPIELLSFTGKCDKGNILVNWSTATGVDNKSFTVERNIQGTNWDIVGTMPGAGNSSNIHTYTLTDKLPYNGDAFYRLKISGSNGVNTYSNIIFVKQCNTDLTHTAAIYPNPSSGKFDLVYTGNSSEVHSIQIYNADGQEVYALQGLQSKFDLSRNAPGIYFLHINMDAKTTILKIVIR